MSKQMLQVPTNIAAGTQGQNEDSDIQTPNLDPPMPHPQEDVRNANPAALRKGPTIDYNKQRLEKLISDSNRRRTRYQRGLEIAINGIPQTEIANAGLGLEESKLPRGLEDSSNQIDLPSNRSRAGKEQVQNTTGYLSSQNNKSSTRKSQVNYLEKNKKLLETPKDQTRNVTNLKSAQNQSSVINNPKFWHQNLRGSANNSVISNPFTQTRQSFGFSSGEKLVKSKINTGLRESSALGKVSRQAKSPQQRAKDNEPSVKLGMSPQDRLNEDLQKRITEELKQDIKEQINSKYSEIEGMLNQNIAAVNGNGDKYIENVEIPDGPQTQRIAEVKLPTTKKSVIMTNAPINKKTAVHPFKLATDKRSERRNDSKSSISSISSIKTQPVVSNAVNKNPTIPTQTIELIPKSKIGIKAKVPSVARPTVSSSANRISSVRKEPVSTVANKSQPKVQPNAHQKIKHQVNKIGLPMAGGRNNSIAQHSTQPVLPGEAFQPDFDRDDDAPTPNREVPIQQRVGGGSHTGTNNKSKINIPRKRKLSGTQNPYQSTNNPLFNSDSVGSQLNFAASLDFNEEINPQQNQTQSQFDEAPSVTAKPSQASTPHIKKARESSLNNINLKNKDDVINLDIELIWKEMEDIKRSKNAAHQLYNAFQDKYQDQPSQMFDQTQMSPTKRLVDMKNATTKHHVIEYRKGITGRYAIQYTTCPEKSYVILPDAGETNYDKIKDGKAHQFVDKMISATVEKVELEEKGKIKRSTNKRTITHKTPVAITSSNCQRAELIGGVNLNGSAGERKQVSFQNDEDNEEDDERSHNSFESQGKPDIELQKEEEMPGKQEAILEDDQNGQPEEQSIDAEESIINICNGKDSEGRQSIIVVEEKVNGSSGNMQRQVSSGISPMPTSNVPVPITLENMALANSHDGQPEIVPFMSDEQPIKPDQTGSVISAAHEEEIEILEHNPQAQSNLEQQEEIKGEPTLYPSPDTQHEDEIPVVHANHEPNHAQKGSLNIVPEDVEHEQNPTLEDEPNNANEEEEQKEEAKAGGGQQKSKRNKRKKNKKR